MRTITAEQFAHIRQTVTTIASCWVIEKRDGTFIRGTDHDSDITIEPTDDSPDSELVGTYLAAANINFSDTRRGSDFSVDNSEVDGALAEESAPTIDVNVADIEAGFFDGAPVTHFLVNWQAPDEWQFIDAYGYLGEISRDSDRKYTTEFRFMKQLLTQIFVRTFSERCQVKRFGDSECKLDLEPLKVTGVIQSVTNAKRFVADIDVGTTDHELGYFNGGELTITSGANAGVTREVKRDDNDDTFGHVSLWEAFPYDLEPNVTFELTPGCPRTSAACKRFGNYVNFRGYGVLITGMDAVLRGPGL